MVLDDQQGRRVARERALSVTGTVGLLIEARGRGMIPSVRGELDHLIEAGMWIDEEHLSVKPINLCRAQTEPAPVVARGGGRVGMAHQALHDGQVGAGFEQVAGEGAPEVVKGERFHLRFRPELLQDQAQGLAGELLAGRYHAALVDAAEQAPGLAAARLQPAAHGVQGSVEQVGLAALVVLAAHPQFGFILE